MKILVTGAAGFIGAHLCKALLAQYANIAIVGIDNLNDYYDVELKKHRLSWLDDSRFTFVKGDISDKQTIESLFSQPFDVVINLAAQAGVRYSIDHPDVYIQSNVIGFYNILEACRHRGVQHLVYASSSSVYGANTKTPFSVDDKTDSPVSLYAATKKSDELLAYCYSKLYSIPATGLRFFTVYGPAGRPDMAYYKFTDMMVRGKAIPVYNNGDLKRDFTYIDDIVNGIAKIIDRAPNPDQFGVRHAVYNIGNNHPVKLLDFIDTLEKALLKHGIISSPAKKEFLPMQAGDVYQTFADTDPLERFTGFKPSTPLSVGLDAFAAWYKSFAK